MASLTAPLPGLGTVLTAQIRYQLTLLLRTPRALHPGLGPTRADAVAGGDSGKARKRPWDEHCAARRGSERAFRLRHAQHRLHHLRSSLVAAREEGILRRWHMTPLPAWGYFTGRIIASVILADGAGAIVLVIGAVMSHLHLNVDMVVSLFVADTLGALTLAAAGTAVTCLVTSVSGANPILVFTYVPLLIFPVCSAT